MIVLSLTEEDRSLLLPLTPIQRDRVILALLAGGEAEENWGEIEQGILESIRRRGRRRREKNEYSKRYYHARKQGNAQNGVQNNVQIAVQNGRSPSSLPLFLPPSSLSPETPISLSPYNPPFSPTPPRKRAHAKTEKKKTAGESEQEPKVQWAEFVSMTNAEHQKLLDTHGPADTERLIEILDNYKGATGKTYKSDYRAILNWVVTRLQDEKKKRAKEDDPFARLPNKGPIIDKLPSATDGCWDDEPF